MQGARVTIVCPIFNEQKFIRECIDSVLSQTLQDFRLVLLDNGSNDQSRSIISSYRDERLSLVHSQVNLRSELAAALMLQVDTPYLAQIFADDLYLPDRLERTISALESNNADACFSNNTFIDDEGVPLDPGEIPPSQFLGDVSSMSAEHHLNRFLMIGNTLHPVSMTIRASTYRSLGGVKPFLHQIGDMEFFARLLLRHSVVFLPEVLQKIRIRGGERSNESAITFESRKRTVGERISLLSVFRSSDGVAAAQKIFLPDISGACIPDTLKKWFLAQQMLKFGEPDFRFSAAQLMYEALDENFPAIRDHIAALTGKTIGEYMWTVSSTILSDQQFLELSSSAALNAAEEKIRRLSMELSELRNDYTRADRDFRAIRDYASALEQEVAELRAGGASSERHPPRDGSPDAAQLLEDAARSQRLESERTNDDRDRPEAVAGLRAWLTS